MDTQPTQTLDAITKPDRTLVISCKPTLIWTSATPPYSIGASATYTYVSTGSNPDMTGRVHADGDIILHPLPQPQDFTNNVDITMMLDATGLVDPAGNAVRGRWALSTEYSGTGPVTGFAWFCAVQNVSRGQYDKTPIDVDGMSVARIGDTQILIDDNTPGNSSNDYAYCLGLVLPDYGNYYITLDPIVTGKGGGGNPPMMLKY
jgi:hypothetical protein